jgi:hypothetical protein
MPENPYEPPKEGNGEVLGDSTLAGRIVLWLALACAGSLLSCGGGCLAGDIASQRISAVTGYDSDAFSEEEDLIVTLATWSGFIASGAGLVVSYALIRKLRRRKRRYSECP